MFYSKYAGTHTQSCLPPCKPLDHSPPLLSAHRIIPRTLEKASVLSSRVSSWPRDPTRVSCIAGRIFTVEPSGSPNNKHVPLLFWASPVAELVKNLPAVWETRIRSLGWEDLLEKGMAAHSSILAWTIPWTEETGRWQSTRWQKLNTTERLTLALHLPASVFPSESSLHIRWPKYWSFSLASVLPMNIQGWFPCSWFDLIAVQGTLRSLFQHHNLKASIFRCSASFMVQLSLPYSYLW